MRTVTKLSGYKEFQNRFRKLMEDVDQADPLILRLFPSLDFTKAELNQRVVLGLKTALRVLLVAAEKGYVNHQLLATEYAVGGDTRKRVLAKLANLGLLQCSEEISSKKRKKLVHHLSSKGVLLCAAFPRIIKPRDKFRSLIGNFVTEKSLAQVMLMQYEATGLHGNRLSEVLQKASENGINIEGLSQEVLADTLLKAEQEAYSDQRESFLLDLCEQLVERISGPKDKTAVHFSESLSRIVKPEIIELVRSNPKLFKYYFIGFRELIQLLRSSDVQIGLRAMNAAGHLNDREYMRNFFLDVIHPYIKTDSELNLEDLWRRRHEIYNRLRKRLRNEAYAIGKIQSTSVVKHQ